MLHPLILIAAVATLAADTVGLEHAPLLSDGWTVGTLLLSFTLIALAAHVALRRAGRALDRTGSARSLRSADRALSASRVATGLAYIIGVFLLGWVGVVRSVVGDWIGIDEALALSPVLAVYAAGWWSFEPIERRLHEAALLGAIDRGSPVHAVPTRLAYTLEKLRSTVFGALAPLALIVLWAESVAFAADRWGWAPWPMDDERTLAALAAAQLLGAGLVLALSPPIVLAIWSTTRLPAGELRDRLTELCRRHRVRVGGFRVWDTRGAVLNGAVLGVVPRLRYVLLTDAVIERLERAQLDAVMAHEIAHVRRRHMPWLIAGLLASLGWASVVVGAVGSTLSGPIDRQSGVAAAAIDGAALAAMLALGLVGFGFISRLFERQADAFAVRDAAESAGRSEVVAEDAEAMAGALERVARLNHIPPAKFTWRHGSIAGRCRRARALVGAPTDRFPVDRAAGRMKILVAIGVAGLIAMTAIGGRDANNHGGLFQQAESQDRIQP